VSEINDLSVYKAIIAGSAIQAGKWLPEAMAFISTHRDDLNKKPFAAFLVCMTLAMSKGDQYNDTVSSRLQPVKNQVAPLSWESIRDWTKKTKDLMDKTIKP